MAETSVGAALRSDAFLLAVVLLVGVVGSGVVRWWLGQLGYTTVGMAVYAIGYTGMVFTVWYGWIRPLDITGPE